MKTPEELFAALGNRGEYAALPHVTLDEVKMIYREGQGYAQDRISLKDKAISTLRERINELEHETQMWEDHMSQFTDYEGDEAPWQTMEREIENMQAERDQQRAVINKLRLAINETIAISGTGTPQDWTDAQVVLCKALAEVKVMLGEKS